MERFVFPKWTNDLRVPLTVAVVIGVIYVTLLVAYGASPQTTDVGYAPEQPIPYSHALHAGPRGIDCRYCHNTVEHSAQASIPPTQACMNCHLKIQNTSTKLVPLLESYEKGTPVEWVRVHDLPDYVYFNHSAHVRRGIGCASCHGRIDKMEVVRQQERLSMGWCLDCHRHPERHLRPLDRITRMDWQVEDQAALGAKLRREYDINPSTDCSTCHR
jgi:hypothetical protein